jgi:hypothetical protein
MFFCYLLRLAPFFQSDTIRAIPVPSRFSFATPLDPDSFLAAPFLLPMTTSVIRRPRVTFGFSPPSFRPTDLTASVLSQAPIPSIPASIPSSSSSSSFSSSSSSPPSSSFYSAITPSLVSGSRASPSAIFSSNPPLDPPPPSSPPHSLPPSSKATFHSHPIDASFGLRLPPHPVLRSPCDPTVAFPTCQVDFECDSGSKTNYMAHLCKHNSSDVSLVPLQIPALDSPLIRCNRGYFSAAILTSARFFAHVLIVTRARSASNSRRPALPCRNQAHSQDGAAPTGASDRCRYAIRKATTGPHRP